MKDKTPISLVLVKLPIKPKPSAEIKKRVDEALLVIETVLRRDLRFQDQFLRYRDSGLVGILAETDEVGAKTLQKRILHSMQSEKRLKGLVVLTGNATYPNDGEDIQGLLKVAEDRAMGQSKTR